MDDMDIDSILDVPDTPDRLITQTNKGKTSMERGSNFSASGHSGHCNRFIEDTRNGLKVNDRVSRKLLIRAPKSSSTKYDSHSNLAFASGNSSSSSSNNSLNCRRVPGEITNYENKHFQPTEDNKLLHMQSSVGHVVDLAEQNGHVQVGKRDNPCTARGNCRTEGYGKVPRSTSRLPYSSGMSSSIMRLHSANKGKECPSKGSGFDCDDVTATLTEKQPKAAKVFPTSLNSVSSPRVTGQKRLVRNGCISPQNIAKAKQEVQMDKNGHIDVGPNHALPMVSSVPRIGSGATESNEHIDSHKSKGKEIMGSHPLSVEEADAQNTHMRNSVSINEIVKDMGDSSKDSFGSFEELGGWRSTRNRSKKMNLPVIDDHQHLSVERDNPCLVNRLPGNGVTRRKFGKSPGNTNNFPMVQDSASCQSASLQAPTHRLSNLRPQLDQHNEHKAARNMLPKRQRQGSSSSCQGESSGAAMGDSDIVFLGSSGNTLKSSSTQTQSQNGLGILEPIIEIDEASPEVRDGFSAAGGSATATDAMARQIEADEMLARELQEQFYNEVPSFGVGEDDVHRAVALQREESSTRSFPRSPHAFIPRSSLMPSSTRQIQSRSSLNLSRRSSQSRGPNLNRMARLRSRFPGRPRTISSSSSSSRERNSLFPPDMDVDMRMYILEALEAFSDMGVDNNFLQTQREFNENDYEMLLTLDENNHQHGGATDHQINGLPHSTVQSDNFEEGCAICLETPTIGDIIRHLPCLHKFHRDCIDPWLRRRTSCPVCKSSIT